MSTKPVYVDGVTVIEAAHMNTIANAVWDSLGEPTTPTEGIHNLGGYTQAEVDALIKQAAEERSAFRQLLRNPEFRFVEMGLSPQTTDGMLLFNSWRFRHSGSATFSVARTNLSLAIRAAYRTLRAAGITYDGVSGADSSFMMAQRWHHVWNFTGDMVLKGVGAAASGTKSVAVSVVQHFGTGGSPSADVETHCGTFQVDDVGAEDEFQITFTVPSVDGTTLGTNDDSWFEVRFWFTAGANFNTATNSLGIQAGTVYLGKLQLRRGSYATEGFDDTPATIDHQLCDEYYRAIWCSLQWMPTAASQGHRVQVNYDQMIATPSVSITSTTITNTTAHSFLSPTRNAGAAYALSVAAGNAVAEFFAFLDAEPGGKDA